MFFNKKYDNDTKAYNIFNQTSLLQTADITNQSTSLMLSGIATISLLVGGIEIMNIKLVSLLVSIS